jgi:hypothetical protein
MADDIKSLAKRVSAIEKTLTTMEKRLKFVEDRGKVLADSLTSSKDIEKLLDVHYKKMSNDPAVSNKQVMREMELSEKLRDAERKARDKEDEKYRKEAEKISKTYATEADRRLLEARLTTVEAMVRAALAK